MSIPFNAGVDILSGGRDVRDGEWSGEREEDGGVSVCVCVWVGWGGEEVKWLTEGDNDSSSASSVTEMCYSFYTFN